MSLKRAKYGGARPRQDRGWDEERVDLCVKQSSAYDKAHIQRATEEIARIDHWLQPILTVEISSILDRFN